MTTKKQIHIRNRDGALIYNRLYDDGSDILGFESGHGFIHRRLLTPSAYTVHPGWAIKDEKTGLWFVENERGVLVQIGIDI
jgi:hypothetical protein